MPRTPDTRVSEDVYSLDEVARAASIEPDRFPEVMAEMGLTTSGGYLTAEEAVRLTRVLTGRVPVSKKDRAPLTVPHGSDRRTGLPLVASGALHVGLVLAMALATTLGLLSANDTEEFTAKPPVRLVYMMSPGPGGGGGGGGLKSPLPPPPAARRAEEPKPVSSPVPPVRRPPPPPRPRPTPRPPPRPIPSPSVLAPVVTVATDALDRTGLVTLPDAPARLSNGPGVDGGVGAGRGTGNGEGTGPGIGPGTGGGTGGGPYQPGSGVTPPVVLREVRPNYTQEARRRGVEGDVVLQIVVRTDGTVGNVKVLGSLDRGLDQKAVEAVRQWIFGPALRQGQPVDVMVEVSVAFTLR